mmetsp:Transcript_5490/g.9290  ORF Transcript_5490/g.9290 Transcript_5490/m.9290 type:complete len:184 (+) Transcript_5490:442-993(+)
MAAPEDNTKVFQVTCENLLLRRNCRQRPDCIWQNKKCQKGGTVTAAAGCRSQATKTACNLKKDRCEWRLHNGKMKCRRRQGGTSTGPTTGSGLELPTAAKDELDKEFDRGASNVCFCNYPHQTCVKKTAQALGASLHGGNDCRRYISFFVWYPEQNCVCDDATLLSLLFPYPYAGKNCVCFDA